MPLQLRFPKLLHRPADEDARNDRSDCITDDDGNEGKVPNLKGACWKDALVLHEDGKLGEADGSTVRAYANVDILRDR